MAIDEADQSESGQIGSVDDDEPGAGDQDGRSEVAVGRYTWEEFMREHGYESEARSYAGGGDGTDLGLGTASEFEPARYLGFRPAETEQRFSNAVSTVKALQETVDERTVNTIDQLEPGEIDGVDRDDIDAFDEDEFFTTQDGHTTVVNRYDLEKAVPTEKKAHFREEQRYWVNKPYSFVIIFHSIKENEKKYYAVEPHLNEIEHELREFLTGKLRTAVKYSQDSVTVEGDEDERRGVIERETRRLLDRYDLFSGRERTGLIDSVRNALGDDDGHDHSNDGLEGIEVRPEPVVVAEDSETLTAYQVEKLLYLLKRDFIGYERIDPIKHDINVEDISCDGYNSRVFVYHTDYEQIISNVQHGEQELDDFVVKLAQRSGKGISKRRPQVDATLPDGSRAQLTLGREVSDHGTNYTIRQFKDVPFTPIDLVNWNTFSLEEMAFLWLSIENNKSLIFAGGTASGKTTSLNAISLFIPSSAKIVSIEDTREVELPQRNWVASVTRPSFSDDEEGDVNEFDLLEAALRQRPDYIVMGEVRGEEGRDLFQVMSTGHTAYSTFHADTVGEVLKRFTTDPINVSKTMFTALDLVSIQTQTRVEGKKVRRNKNLTEVNHYDAENDEINVQDVYQWQAETDQFIKMGNSNTLDEIKFDRGWDQRRLEEEIFKRKTIIAYLIENEVSDYTRVAATIQAFINDPDTVLTLIANDALLDTLDDLREMESVDIQVDPDKEALVPRPTPDEATANKATKILEEADERILDERKGRVPTGLGGALEGMVEDDDSLAPAPAASTSGDATEEFEFGGEVREDDLDFGADAADIEDLAGGEERGDTPDWVDDDFVYEDADTEHETETDGPIWGEDDAEDGATEGEGGGADDEVESIFGGNADDDVALFDDDALFGESDPDGDGDDEEGSIFGEGE